MKFLKSVFVVSSNESRKADCNDVFCRRHTCNVRCSQLQKWKLTLDWYAGLYSQPHTALNVSFFKKIGSKTSSNLIARRPSTLTTFLMIRLTNILMQPLHYSTALSMSLTIWYKIDKYKVLFVFCASSGGHWINRVSCRGYSPNSS